MHSPNSPVSRPGSSRNAGGELKGSEGTTQNNILASQEQKLLQIFANPSLMKEFRIYAEQGCITENLDFLLDMEQFRGTVSRLAREMHEIYFMPNCDKPLNITNKDRVGVETALKNGEISIYLFDEIEHHIKKLLCLNSVAPFEIWQKERGKTLSTSSTANNINNNRMPHMDELKVPQRPKATAPVIPAITLRNSMQNREVKQTPEAGLEFDGNELDEMLSPRDNLLKFNSKVVGQPSGKTPILNFKSTSGDKIDEDVKVPSPEKSAINLPNLPQLPSLSTSDEKKPASTVAGAKPDSDSDAKNADGTRSLLPNKPWAMFKSTGSATTSTFPASGVARAAVKYANEKDKLLSQFQMIEENVSSISDTVSQILQSRTEVVGEMSSEKENKTGVDKYIDSDFGFTEGDHVEIQPDNLYNESQLNALRKKEKASIRGMLAASKEIVAICDEIKLSKIWGGNTLFLFYYASNELTAIIALLWDYSEHLRSEIDQKDAKEKELTTKFDLTLLTEYTSKITHRIAQITAFILFLRNVMHHQEKCITENTTV